MRKSIFEIASSNLNMENEAKRIIHMAKKENLLCVDSIEYMTLFDYVDDYCYLDWKNRGHFINVNGFLDSINFKDIQIYAAYDSDSLLTLIELIYNFWYLSWQELQNEERGYKLQWCGNYYHLLDVMDDILCQYNHIAHIDDEKSCVLVIEDKPEITAVVEIVPSELSFDVIRYNHKSLQGEVELKKAILLSLGAELEPKRKSLSTLNKQLSENIFLC